MNRRTSLAVHRLEDRLAPAVYSYDGTGNNAQHPDWGSTYEQLLRKSPVAYADGIAAVNGVNRPSPRVISNAVADQSNQDIISDRLLSAMIYAWGQFIDHDLDLTPTGGTEFLAIPVPTGDPSFDPLSTGNQNIYTSRSIFDAATGITNPRQQINVITSWLDGSMIYGSDAAVATKLRTLSNGKMKTSAGNLLPFNDSTMNLPMANDSHLVANSQLFAAGDVRANENIELTSLHTLFVREHNFWAGVFKALNPHPNDEQIFQKARAMVIAEVQAITFNQWLPAILGPGALRPYSGYRPNVNPNVANEFSAAAFRFGHSLLGDDVEFLDNQGLPIAEEVALSRAFFNPGLVSANGIDSILKYLASDPSSELDTKVVDGVRNFLFGPPGAGGLDLASLNIMRGREHGLADYNTVRTSYGLPHLTSFAQITHDTAMQAKLQQLYGSVNNIDLWVGALAEDHVRGGSVGPTLRAIIADQFTRVRDGDSLWYQRSLSWPMVQLVNATSLSDIMQRNTEMVGMQHDSFYFDVSISGKVFGDINRNGKLNGAEHGLAGRTVTLIDLSDNSVMATTVTNGQGRYYFGVEDDMRTGQYAVRVTLPPGQMATTPPRIIAITGGDDYETQNLGLAPLLPPPPPHGPGPFQFTSKAIALSGATTAPKNDIV